MSRLGRLSVRRYLAGWAGEHAVSAAASIMIHGLLAAGVVMVGVRVAPRLLPLVDAELVSFDRETPARPVGAPAPETLRQVVPPRPAVPRVVPAPAPPRPVEALAPIPPPPAPVIEPPRAPQKVEDKPPKPEERPARVEGPPITSESRPSK